MLTKIYTRVGIGKKGSFQNSPFLESPEICDADCPLQTPNRASGPKWEKMAEKWILALPGKRGKIWPKNGKMAIFDPLLGQFSDFSAIFPPFSRWGQNPFFGHFLPISGRRRFGVFPEQSGSQLEILESPQSLENKSKSDLGVVLPHLPVGEKSCIFVFCELVKADKN